MEMWIGNSVDENSLCMKWKCG